jgi:predicted MPP superfamily phosphohydrolase
VEQKAPDYLYLHLSSFPVKQSFTKYLHALSERLPNAHILLSGAIADQHKKNLPQNAELLKSLHAVTSYIQTI